MKIDIAWMVGIGVIVVAAVFGFLLWLNWWLPQVAPAFGAGQ